MSSAQTIAAVREGFAAAARHKEENKQEWKRLEETTAEISEAFDYLKSQAPLESFRHIVKDDGITIRAFVKTSGVPHTEQAYDLQPFETTEGNKGLRLSEATDRFGMYHAKPVFRDEQVFATNEELAASIVGAFAEKVAMHNKVNPEKVSDLSTDTAETQTRTTSGITKISRGPA